MLPASPSLSEMPSWTATGSPLPAPSWTSGGFAGNAALSYLNTSSPFKMPPRLSHYWIFTFPLRVITSILTLGWLSTPAKPKEETIISARNSSIRPKTTPIGGEVVSSPLRDPRALTLSIVRIANSKKSTWPSAIKTMVFLNSEPKEKINHCRVVVYSKALRARSASDL